jgi:hypothetical protein
MSGMGRREFVALLGGATAAWPLAGRAQPERIRRIGVLITLPADDLEGRTRLAAFSQALQQLGWTDGRNVRIDIRWGGLNADVRKLAAELVEFAPDVILTSSSVATAAMLQATRTCRSSPARRRGSGKQRLTWRHCSPSHRRLTSISAATASQCSTKRRDILLNSAESRNSS